MDVGKIKEETKEEVFKISISDDAKVNFANPIFDKSQKILLENLKMMNQAIKDKIDKVNHPSNM